MSRRKHSSDYPVTDWVASKRFWNALQKVGDAMDQDALATELRQAAKAVDRLAVEAFKLAGRLERAAEKADDEYPYLGE